LVFVPAVHIVPDPIFIEWPLCVATFLIAGVLDKRPATIPDSQ